MREKFCNPVPFSDGRRHTNPDPFIMRWCGRYYCYATDEAGVKVSVSEDMVHWDFRGFAISEKECHHYWAPSVIYLNGMFYMYYSNIPMEEEDCHEQHLKLAVSEDPLGPFVYRKTFFEKFSIDSHPLKRGGELYMFYSVNDWLGLEEKVAGTCILLDKMVSPEEFAGDPKPVVLPSLPQEIYAENRFGDGRDWYTIEGASPVFHGDKCWVLYSANAFENIYYFVGTAVAEIKGSLWDMEWRKYPDEYTWTPLLKKNDVVEGTGHNTVAKAPNLFEDWIVYHGRDIEEGLRQGTEQRNMRIDPLLYFQDRMFCPGPSFEERDVPGKSFFAGREIAAKEKVFFAEAKDFYRMEIWCSAGMSHAGARYMLYPLYRDEKNYIALEMHSGLRKMSVIRRRGGIAARLGSMELPAGYRFDVPHLIGVERKRDRFRVTLDDDLSMDFADSLAAGASRALERIGIGGCFTPVSVQNVVIAEGAELFGEELVFLPEFYDCSPAEIKDGALRRHGDVMRLTGNTCAFGDGSTYGSRDSSGVCTERFTWKSVQADGRADLYHGEEKLCTLESPRGGMTFYYYKTDKKVYLLTDGKIIDEGKAEVKTLSGISVLSTKKEVKMPLTLEVRGLALEDYMWVKG